MTVAELQPRRRTDSALRGSAVHLFLKDIFNGVDSSEALRHVKVTFDSYRREMKGYLTTEEIDDLFLSEAHALGMCKGYLKAHNSKVFTIVAVELTLSRVVYDKDLEPIAIYLGTVDTLVKNKKGKLWILEHKTRSYHHDSTTDWLALDQQNLGYNWLVRGDKNLGCPEGVIWDEARKSKVRLKKGQTPEDFIEELLGVYEREPDKYFRRFAASHSLKSLEDWHRDLVADLEDMYRAAGTGTYSKNTGACLSFGSQCMWMPLCLNGPTTSTLRLYKKEAPKYWDPKKPFEGELS